MQKVLAILEQYVEFIVLGLGVLFLLFMAWTYLLQTPVTINVGGQQLRPGEIDAATVHGPIETLDRRMAEAHPPKVTVPDFKTKLIAGLNPPEPQPFADANWNAIPADVKIQLPKGPGTVTNPEETVVKALPQIPAPEIADTDQGRSNVVLPPEGWQPGTPLPVVNVQALIAPPSTATPTVPGSLTPTVTPNRYGQPGQPANGMARRPGQPNQPIQPNNPAHPPVVPAQPLANAPAIPGQPGTAQPILADKDWVTVMYKLPMKGIADAFTAVNIPQNAQLNLFKTCILDVELVRQEIVDGKPVGDETIVKKLEISGVPQPIPTDLAGELQYIGWAAANEGQIIQPGFFQVARGDPWFPPGVQEAIAANQPQVQANQPFDPSRKYTPQQIQQLTPAQRYQIQQYNEQQRRAKMRSTPSNDQTGTPDIPQGDMSPAVPDLSRLQFAQAAPPPDMQDVDGGDMSDNPEGDQTPGIGGLPQAPASFAQFPLPPAGEFDPRMAPDPTIGWAIDDTVEPGKSYRYKVRYKIKNPVFQIFNAKQPQNLANVFAITSPDSAWTQPVSIPPLTRFFVASLFNNKVSLQIFRWQNGELHTHTVNVAPGDLISYKDPTGIDYSTGWTLVDITNDPGRRNLPMIIVSDPSGKLSRRDFESDSNDPEYQKMKNLIQAPVALR